MSLPIYHVQSVVAPKDFLLLQTNWKSQIDPFISAPLQQGSILKNVNLINGATVINHLLGRLQQGWFLTDLNSLATVFRSSAFTTTTLTLTSNAACVVNIYVF